MANDNQDSPIVKMAQADTKSQTSPCSPSSSPATSISSSSSFSDNINSDNGNHAIANDNQDSPVVKMAQADTNLQTSPCSPSPSPAASISSSPSSSDNIDSDNSNNASNKSSTSNKTTTSNPSSTSATTPSPPENQPTSPTPTPTSTETLPDNTLDAATASPDPDPPCDLTTENPNQIDYSDSTRFWGIPQLRAFAPPDLTVISPGFPVRLRAHRAVFSASSRHFHKTLECGEDFLPCGPSMLNYNIGTATLELYGGPPLLWAAKILSMYHLHIYPTPERGGLEARITQPMLDELRALMQRPEELDPFGVERLRGCMGGGEGGTLQREMEREVWGVMERMMAAQMAGEGGGEGECGEGRGGGCVARVERVEVEV
ncbi:hypothetical protein K490DRAFT_63359 [Saccharata proteae CBS 121410]|uniref:BTB domain-containing protein n=1 Tax=Saccharata proteae CBS 121410 TaxID=1314787 RepID=A0A6A5YBH3_9PEZI|nr:hypothetical protein K490DRAFT_63359 [Saccharata proteae CBS 121410]